MTNHALSRRGCRPPHRGAGAEEEIPAPANEPLAGPSVQVAGRDEAAPLDNYAEFIRRLETASGKLIPRRDALSAALDAAGLLLNQNNAGVELWGQRLHSNPSAPQPSSREAAGPDLPEPQRTP